MSQGQAVEQKGSPKGHMSYQRERRRTREKQCGITEAREENSKKRMIQPMKGRKDEKGTPGGWGIQLGKSHGITGKGASF